MAFFDIPKRVHGKYIERMSWTFSEGRLVSWEAEPSSLFQWVLDGMSGDKDRIGHFLIGLNPGMKPGYPFDEIAEGMVSIGIGFNERYGGQNKGAGMFIATMSKATVKADGKEVVKNGFIAKRNQR